MRRPRRHHDAVQLRRRSAVCGGDELHVGIVYCRPDRSPRRAEASESMGIVRHVWECCQDWYDSLPGGFQVDPTGPPGPVLFESKVMRGGAYDYPNSSCRSASRLFFPATPFHTDSDVCSSDLP